jgi:hypothetical protein
VNGNGRQAALYEVFTFGSLFPLAGAPLHFNAFTGPSGLPLLDDTTIRYDFPPGFSFPIAGVSARTMFVHSNGNVTFGSGYGEVESGEDVPSLLFLFPRLAPLWNDFDPKHRSTGFEGQITLTQGAEDVTVDWSVPVYGTTNVNDFGVTLRADGTFSFRYGRVDSLDGIVGYSTGGFRALGSEPAVDLSVANPLHAGSETAVYEQFDGAVRVFDLAQRTLGWTGAYETIHRGRASPGATLGFALARSPADAGLVHVLGLSIGSTPGIPIDVRTLPLNVDGLLLASLLVGPPVFQSFVGTLDALGETVGPAIALPAVPGLVGVAPFVAWLTLDPTAPSGIRTISRATRFTIAP